MNKCHSCSNDSKGKYYCESCGVEHNKRKKIVRMEQKESRICANCGGEKDTNYRICETCRIKSTNRIREQNQKRKEEGACNIISCKYSKSNKSKFCEYHRLESISKKTEKCAKLIDMGLCTICACEPYMDCYKNRTIMTKICQSCNFKRNETARQKYKERLENDLCTICGVRVDNKRALCSICRDKKANEQKVRSKRRFVEGRCNVVDCNNQRLINDSLCEIHRIKRLETHHKRAIRLADDGLCTCCGKEPFLECFKNKGVKDKFCLEHYLRQRANHRLHNSDLWINLLDKLKEQNYKCFYTGQTLTLGVNDSVDHVFSVSCFPERANDIANIQWVSRDVNWMKNNWTHEKFMNLIEKIYKYRKEMEEGKKISSPPP